jgi:hypothetical protein
MIRPDAVEIAIDAQADDWLRARAEDRVRKKRHNFRQADASDAYLNYIGIRCEYALTRYLVIPFDWHLAAVQGNKGRTNLLYQGRRIDAKFTQATGYYVDFRDLEPMAELKDPPPPAAPAPVQGGLFVA